MESLRLWEWMRDFLPTTRTRLAEKKLGSIGLARNKHRDRRAELAIASFGTRTETGRQFGDEGGGSHGCAH